MFANSCKQPWRMLWTTTAVMLLAVGLTHAAKPGGGTVPAGRIYFFGTDIGVMASMKADGSDKAPEFEWEPSRLLHEGRRWFLDVRPTPELGFYPPQGTEGVVHPRREVFAVRDDGYTVQLTDDPLTKPQGTNTGLLRWSHTDSFISFIGVQWDANGVAQGVICAASVVFVDGIPMLIEAPSVWMDSGVWKDGGFTYPDLQGHDWSPTGAELVFCELVGGDIWPAGGVYPELYVTKFDTERVTAFLDYGSWPECSSNGRIVFGRYNTSGSGHGTIWTVLPNGSELFQVTSPSAAATDRYPTWSPDSQQIAMIRSFRKTSGGNTHYDYDVLRVPAIGGTAVNLTKDIDGGTLIVAGWR
jgi:hypothetical protein